MRGAGSKTDGWLEQARLVPRRWLLIRACWMVLAAIMLSMPGCSEELGPVRFTVTTVRGVVREGSRAVGGGWIEFFPVDGTVGNLRSARIGRDGSFKIEGVAIGKNLVRLVNLKLESPAVERLFGAMQSPIRRVITNDSTTPIEIDLIDEVLRFQEAQQASAARKVRTTGKTQ